MRHQCRPFCVRCCPSLQSLRGSMQQQAHAHQGAQGLREVKKVLGYVTPWYLFFPADSATCAHSATPITNRAVACESVCTLADAHHDDFLFTQERKGL